MSRIRRNLILMWVVACTLAWIASRVVLESANADPGLLVFNFAEYLIRTLVGVVFFCLVELMRLRDTFYGIPYDGGKNR